jgi:hypothetical protein
MEILRQLNYETLCAPTAMVMFQNIYILKGIRDVIKQELN